VNAARRVAPGWRVLTWNHWAWATGLAVALAAWMPVQNMDINPDWAVRRALYHMPWFILFGYVFLAAIAWVESEDGLAPPSMARYAGALAAATFLCILLAVSLASFIAMPPGLVVDGALVPMSAKVDPAWNRRFGGAIVGFHAAFHAWLAILIYICLRRSRRMARALADAEFARSEASRDLLASQLEAAQAEIDPTRVIERLEAIERLYEADSIRADVQLDELIVVLREAIPRLRSIPIPAPLMQP
jgi:hypothetical protein